jgi:hypothetical protein
MKRAFDSAVEEVGACIERLVEELDQLLMAPGLQRRVHARPRKFRQGRTGCAAHAVAAGGSERPAHLARDCCWRKTDPQVAPLRRCLPRRSILLEAAWYDGSDRVGIRSIVGRRSDKANNLDDKANNLDDAVVVVKGQWGRDARRGWAFRKASVIQGPQSGA